MPPSALDCIHEIIAEAGGKRPVVFLDYDGTLTPIVGHPEDAWLPESMRQTLRSLASHLPVAILSGRDLDDVRGRVLVDGIVYAGSHGFDIAGAGGLRREFGAAYLPVLDEAETSWTELQRRQLAGALLTLTPAERVLCDRRYHGRWTTARLAREAGVEEAVIRKRLQELSRTIAFSSNESPLAKLAHAQKLSAFFANDVEVTIDVPGRSVELAQQ